MVLFLIGQEKWCARHMDLLNDLARFESPPSSVPRALKQCTKGLGSIPYPYPYFFPHVLDIMNIPSFLAYKKMIPSHVQMKEREGEVTTTTHTTLPK